MTGLSDLLPAATPAAGEALVAIAAGLALAAAAGLRVFLPLFGLGVAGVMGWMPLAEQWSWLATPVALGVLGTATVLEIGAYYVPWLDHLLDTIATPTAVVAGVIASMAVVGDLPPALAWTIGIVGGGGVAGFAQGLSVLARAKSGLLTGGLANPLVSTGEWVGALLLVVLAIVVPVVALVLVVIAMVTMVRKAGRAVFRRRRNTVVQPQGS